MGKYFSLFFGIVFILAGLFFLFEWGYEVMFVIRGIAPGIFFVLGLVALAAAAAEYKDGLRFRDKDTDRS